MFLDERNEFCDATSAILAIGNAIIGDVIDRQANTNTLIDLGTGEPVYLVIQVATAFVGGTTDLALRSDSVAALTASPTTHWTSGAIAAATLVAGYTIVVALPMQMTYERFLGIWETVAGANVTAGAINAFLTKTPPKANLYVDAVS